MALETLYKLESISNTLLDQLIKIDQEVMDFPWQAQQWRDFLNEGKNWMITIELEQRVLKGFALFQLSEDDWSHLLKIGVMEQFKRLGIASSIIESSLSTLAQRHKSCSLEVREDNQAAISLYKRYDFKPLHTKRNYYSDGASAVKMITSLR